MFRVKNCHLCGKEMCRCNWDDYHYRYGTRYFCSWNCYRKWYNEHRVDDLEQEEKEKNKYAQLGEKVGMSEGWVRQMFKKYGEVTIDDLRILKQNRGKWEKLLKGDK